MHTILLYDDGEMNTDLAFPSVAGRSINPPLNRRGAISLMVWSDVRMQSVRIFCDLAH